MAFQGIGLMDIDMLGLSRIYRSFHKMLSIEEWFDPQCPDNFQPLSVYDFGNNMYTITDGHTKAYAVYKNGISVLTVS